MNSQITSPCFNGAPADPRHHAAGRRSFRSAQGWRRSLLAAATAVLLGAAAAQAAEPLPMLLGSPPTARVSTQAATTLMANRALASERQVAINFQYLDPQSGKAPAQLGVELFDGEVVTLERGRIEQRGPGNYTWLGHVQGVSIRADFRRTTRPATTPWLHRLRLPARSRAARARRRRGQPRSPRPIAAAPST